MNKELEIDNILDIIEYGVEHQDGLDTTDGYQRSYRDGGLDTTGHILACLLVQRLGLNSYPTTDAGDDVHAMITMNREKRREYLMELLEK